MTSQGAREAAVFGPTLDGRWGERRRSKVDLTESLTTQFSIFQKPEVNHS